jgi:hypothetical protein
LRITRLVILPIRGPDPWGRESGWAGDVSKAFVALDHANGNAFSEHKLNGECGKAGQPKDTRLRAGERRPGSMPGLLPSRAKGH